MSALTVTQGNSSVVLGQPHGGTDMPDKIFQRLNTRGSALSDTDWHITRLYKDLLPGATLVTSNVHRYVIDANRDPSGASLYPGANTTALCPVTDFDGQEIWKPGQAPDADEILERRERYHRPYHAALAEQLERVRAKHGVVILYDCHSIRSTAPFLFDGSLPVFSIGTNDGKACKKLVADITERACAAAEGFTYIVNGRFKGGWTTRHYGNPALGIHAIQMELAQRAYMQEEPPWIYDNNMAAVLRGHLAKILNNLDAYARSGAL